MAKVITTELQHAGASGANITLDSSKNVTVENNLTVDGNISVTGTGLQDTLNNRNLFINGAMRIRQRGDVTNAGNEYGGPDRWRFAKNDGAFNISQTDTVPAGQGFKSSYKIDCTSTSGASGNYYVNLEQRLEGLELQRLKYGSSNAQSLTLSFWIRSTKTGTYIATLRNEDQNKHISKSYTVSSSNTWEKKTITFPGDTAAGFDNDSGESLRVRLWVFAGSNYTSGTLATSWATITAANEAVGQVNGGDNTSNDIYFTGIQLEPGSTATDFEHRSYGDELASCQRYYSKSGEYLSSGYGSSDGYARGGFIYPVTMRATPTLTLAESGSGSIIASGGDEYCFYVTYSGLTGTGAGLFSYTASAEL